MNDAIRAAQDAAFSYLERYYIGTTAEQVFTVNHRPATPVRAAVILATLDIYSTSEVRDAEKRIYRRTYGERWLASYEVEELPPVDHEADGATGLCTACTIAYRREHEVSIDHDLRTLSGYGGAAPAEGERPTLEYLETQARKLEADHRFAPLGERMFEYVIDDTPCMAAGWQARVRLLVWVGYNKFAEQMAFYGNKAALEGRAVPGKLCYRTHFDGRTFDMKRKLAKKLLATGELPFEPPPLPEPSSKEEMAELFAQLGAKVHTRDTGPGRVGQAGAPSRANYIRRTR